MKLNDDLLQAVSFRTHNLSVAYLSLCKNVLICSKQDLQDRCMQTFKDALVGKGFMLLSAKEDYGVKSLTDVSQQEK